MKLVLTLKSWGVQNKNMRALAMGDIHGKLPKKLVHLVRDKHIDVIFSIGDYKAANVKFRNFQIQNRTRIEEMTIKGLTWNQAIKKVMGESSYKEMVRIERTNYLKGITAIRQLSKIGKPVLSVYGNVDNFQDLKCKTKSMKNFRLVHGKMIEFGGYNVLGIGDYRRPYHRTEDTFQNKVEGLLKRANKKTVILSHYPPYGVLDRVKNRHTGDLFLTHLIRKYSPLLLVCGHIHESAGIKKFGDTFVTNTGEAAKSLTLIELNDGLKLSRIHL